jgi:hypothetical protein
MRKIILFSLLVVFSFCFLGTQSKQSNPFEGTWELMSVTTKGTLLVDGKPLNIDMVKDANHFGMKIIHDGYFMFSGQDFFNGVASGSYGYGKYIFKDNVYTEHVIYHVDKGSIGKSPSYEMIANENTLTQRGPLKTGDFKDIKFEITETYLRK